MQPRVLLFQLVDATPQDLVLEAELVGATHGPPLELGQPCRLAQGEVVVRGSRREASEQPDELAGVVVSAVMELGERAVLESHARSVQREVPAQPILIAHRLERVPAESIRLHRRVAARRDPTVATGVIEDVRRPPTRHGLQDRTSVSDDDVGLGDGELGLGRRRRTVSTDLHPLQGRILPCPHQAVALLAGQVVAEEQHPSRLRADRPSIREPRPVHGLAQPHHLGLQRERIQAPRHPVVQHHHRRGDPLGQRWAAEREVLGVRDEHVRRVRVVVSKGLCDDGVIGHHCVARAGQSIFAGGHG